MISRGLSILKHRYLFLLELVCLSLLIFLVVSSQFTPSVSSANAKQLTNYSNGWQSTNPKDSRLPVLQNIEPKNLSIGFFNLPSTPSWITEGDQDGAWYGGYLGNAGDINGDGYDDIIVGAPLYDNSETDEGRVFVYFGSAAGLSALPDWTAEGNQAGARFSSHHGSIGDVNGYRYDDVFIGATMYDNGQTDEGRVYGYYGSPTGLNLTPDWIIESNQAYSYFGSCVSGAGDVNSDGFDDVIVSADYYDNGQTNEGKVFIYYGSATGLDTIPAWTAEGNQTNAYLGAPCGTAGDVNGDGYDDIFASSYQFDNGQVNEGRVFVYYGSAIGPSLTADWVADGDQDYADFGYWTGTAGDVNADDYDDLIIGALYFDSGQTDEGKVFVYYGSATGLNGTANWMAEGDQAGAKFGSAGLTAGDVNGDGSADIIIGAYQYDSDHVNGGQAFLFYGSTAGLSTTADWIVEGDQDYAEFGLRSQTAGDINGDGLDDVLTGARLFDNGQTDEGRAYAYYSVSQATATPTSTSTTNATPTETPTGTTTATPTETLTTDTPTPTATSTATASDTPTPTLTTSPSSTPTSTSTGSSTPTSTPTATPTFIPTPTPTGTPTPTATATTTPNPTSTVSPTPTRTSCVPLAGPVIYTSDFEGPVELEWSHNSTDITPSGRRFLGQFNTDAVQLTLLCLPLHTTVSISFDLYLIRSWDGNQEIFSGSGALIGPDIWDFRIAGDPASLHTTFTHWSNYRQAYPDTFPGGENPACSGADENNTLGYYFFDDPMDSVYQLSFTLPHTSETLVLEFSASGLQDITDESWGLDNIRVTVQANNYNLYLPMIISQGQTAVNKINKR